MRTTGTRASSRSSAPTAARSAASSPALPGPRRHGRRARADLGPAEAGLPRVRRLRGQHQPRDPGRRPRARLTPARPAMPVERPTRDIASCRAAHERMVRVLDGVTEEVAGHPSLLPDWTVAHVVTHLARNAESMHRRIEAARRGELVEQYVGGEAGPGGGIEAGAPPPPRA